MPLRDSEVPTIFSAAPTHETVKRASCLSRQSRVLSTDISCVLIEICIQGTDKVLSLVDFSFSLKVEFSLDDFLEFLELFVVNPLPFTV